MDGPVVNTKNSQPWDCQVSLRPPCLTSRCARKTSPLGWSCYPAAWRLSPDPHGRIHMNCDNSSTSWVKPWRTSCIQRIQLLWTCWKMLNKIMSTSFLMTAMVQKGSSDILECGRVQVSCDHLGSGVVSNTGTSNLCPATFFDHRFSLQHFLLWD